MNEEIISPMWQRGANYSHQEDAYMVHLNNRIKEVDSMGNSPMEPFFEEPYNTVYSTVIFEPSSFRGCYCLIGYNE